MSNNNQQRLILDFARWAKKEGYDDPIGVWFAPNETASRRQRGEFTDVSSSSQRYDIGPFVVATVDHAPLQPRRVWFVSHGDWVPMAKVVQYAVAGSEAGGWYRRKIASACAEAFLNAEEFLRSQNRRLAYRARTETGEWEEVTIEPGRLPWPSYGAQAKKTAA